MDLKLLWTIGVAAATILWSIETIPQLIKTLKTKKVDDISIYWIIMCVTAFILFEVSMVLHGNWFYFYTHLLPAGCMCALLVLIIKYRKKVK